MQQGAPGSFAVDDGWFSGLFRGVGTARPGAQDRRANHKQWIVWSLALAATVSEGTMSFLDHLDELRKRLIVAVGSFVVGVLIAYSFVSRIQDFMMRPLQQTLRPGGHFVATELMETFVVQLKMAALAGVFIASPVILWQLWLFVAPGLYAREKKFAIPFVLFSSVFFIGGGLFSHFVAFRWAFAFFASSLTPAGIESETSKSYKTSKRKPHLPTHPSHTTNQK